MACAICNTRREKRYCPGLPGRICAICCGEQREETVNCPLDCEYLLQARDHESRVKKDPAGLPNPEFRVSQDFLERNLPLIVTLQEGILLASLGNNAVDNDVKEALEGLARTYKTLGSGLYYESRPTNPMAAAVFDAFQQRVAQFREAERERAVHHLLDSHILTVIEFLRQMEYAMNNGRRKGRSFLDSLRESLAEIGDAGGREPGTSLLVS